MCKICSGESENLESELSGINYYYCKACEYIFSGEEKLLPPEEEKRRYLLHDNTEDNTGYVEMFDELIRKNLLPYRGKLRTALDFGCGQGKVLAGLLKKYGFCVDVYDKYFFPEPVYENKKYDLITATELIEHLKNPMKVLAFMKNHLNDKGLIMIVTLFHPGDGGNFKKWWYRNDSTHISFYTPCTMKYIAHKLNMRVIMMDQKNTCILEK